MILYYITVVVIFSHFLLGMILLFAPKITNLPNKLLAGQILCAGALHLMNLYFNYPYSNFYDQLFGIDYAIASCMGPFIYLYAYCYIKGTLPRNAEIMHHFFIPIGFTLAYLFSHITNHQNGFQIPAIETQLMSRIQYLSDSLVFAQGFTYVLVAFFLYRKGLRRLTPRKKPQLRWLRMYFINTFIFVLCVISLGLIKNGRLTGMYLAILSLTYYAFLIWQSLSTSKIFSSESPVLENKLTDFSKEAMELMLIIENRRLYANKEITLEMLACQLEMSKHQIASILNSHMGISFNDLINILRIKEAKIKLLDPHYDLFTVEAIGLEAGFGSRSTFYELFKKHTGFTPSEYKLQRNVISG